MLFSVHSLGHHAIDLCRSKESIPAYVQTVHGAFIIQHRPGQFPSPKPYKENGLGEIWCVVEMYFSKDDELSLYDGFVITGSCSDAYGNKKLICDLVTLIK
ncbi:hypothetical protein MTR_5g078650 [Medicago truncatula]|uniref:Uncharacterized protein n=1 Tax=Medicago truncatula TaxID=3880 RepID=G7K1T2_MEDTR|nr:hypothetical protein MTR_5g078650 [Medicago truncatula]